MTEINDDLIQFRINRAFETLREAETMIEHQFWNASVNRVYYACFYAVSALLLKKGVDSTTHKGLRQMFGLHFIQTGVVSKEYGKFFSDLFDRRQTGDYDDFITFDKETALNLFSTGRDFVKEIEALIR
jgi:uncharacterized protein (UPF0332 family)